MISSPKFGFQCFEAQSPILSFDEISSINPTEQKLEGSEQQINLHSIFQNKPFQDSIQAFDLSNNESVIQPQKQQDKLQAPDFFKKLDFKDANLNIETTPDTGLKQNLFDNSNSLFSSLQFTKRDAFQKPQQEEAEPQKLRITTPLEMTPHMPAIELFKSENKPLRPLLRSQFEQPQVITSPAPWAQMPVDIAPTQEVSSDKPRTPSRYQLETQQPNPFASQQGSFQNIPIQSLFTITPHTVIDEQVSLSETSQTTFNFPIQTCIGPQGVREERVPEFGSPEQNGSLKFFIESESQQGSFGSPSLHTQETQKFVIKMDDELETIKNQKLIGELYNAQNDIPSFMDKDSFAAEPILFESSHSSSSIIQQLMPQSYPITKNNQFDDLENILPNNPPISDQHFLNKRVQLDETPHMTVCLYLKISTLKISLVKEIIKYKLLEKKGTKQLLKSDKLSKQENIILKLKQEYLALMSQLKDQDQNKKFKIDRTGDVKIKTIQIENNNDEELNDEFNIEEKVIQELESRNVEQSHELDETIKITPQRKVSPSPQKSILTNTIKPQNQVRAVDLIKPDLAIQQEMMLGHMHYNSVKNQLDTFKQGLGMFKEDQLSTNCTSIIDISNPPTLFNHQHIQPNYLYPMQYTNGLAQSQPINLFQQQYPQANTFYSQQIQQANMFQSANQQSRNIFQPQQNYQGNVFQSQQNLQKNLFQPSNNNVFAQQQGNIFQKPISQTNQQRSQSPNFLAQQKPQVNPYPNVSPYNVFQQPNLAQIPTQQVIRNAQQTYQQNVFQTPNQPIIPITQQQNPFQPQVTQQQYQTQQQYPASQNIFQNPQNPFTPQYNAQDPGNKNSKGSQQSGTKTVSFAGTSQIYSDPYQYNANIYTNQTGTRPGTPVKTNSRYNTRSRQI